MAERSGLVPQTYKDYKAFLAICPVVILRHVGQGDFEQNETNETL